MLQWFQRLIPRQDVFFPAFERHAAVMVKAALALREMVAGGDQLKPCFQNILDLEHEADGIAREVLLGLRTTFITPFDREDIQSLITSMDDSVDQCKATAKAIMCRDRGPSPNSIQSTNGNATIHIPTIEIRRMPTTVLNIFSES